MSTFRTNVKEMTNSSNIICVEEKKKQRRSINRFADEAHY